MRDVRYITGVGRHYWRANERVREHSVIWRDFVQVMGWALCFWAWGVVFYVLMAA